MQQRDKIGNTDHWQGMAALSFPYPPSIAPSTNGKKPIFRLPMQLLAAELLG
jgi:hypothetical protein